MVLGIAAPGIALASGAKRKIAPMRRRSMPVTVGKDGTASVKIAMRSNDVVPVTMVKALHGSI